jgi:hypothetical protein
MISSPQRDLGAMFFPDLHLPAAPELLGHLREYTIFSEGRDVLPPRVGRMLDRDRERYTDLCGRDALRVIHLLDWRSAGSPFCVTAISGNQVVAAAWAGKVALRVGIGTGCNLSFAVAPAHAGQGLATLLTAIAYLQCWKAYPEIEFANIHTEANNVSAHALARRLCMERAPEFDCSTLGNDPRFYVTFRSPASVVATQCCLVLDVSLDQGFAARVTGDCESEPLYCESTDETNCSPS